MTSEEARELKHFRPWEALCEEIDGMIGSATQSLIICKPEDVVKTQEKVKALQSLKTLPQDIIDREE